MDGNLVLLAIAIVFLPGILWASIDSKFSSESNPSFAFYIANSFVFGMVAYVFLMLSWIVAGLVFGFDYVDFYSYAETLPFGWALVGGFLILHALLLTPFLAMAWLRIKRAGWLLRIFKSARGEPYTGETLDEWRHRDVWSYLIEKDTSDYRVRVIENETSRSYVGDVEVVSRSGQNKEIMLNKVFITDHGVFQGENEFSDNYRDYLYISLPSEKFSLEFLKVDKKERTDD